jgi:hypothetical protein
MVVLNIEPILKTYSLKIPYCPGKQMQIAVMFSSYATKRLFIIPSPPPPSSSLTQKKKPKNKKVIPKSTTTCIHRHAQ